MFRLIRRTTLLAASVLLSVAAVAVPATAAAAAPAASGYGWIRLAHLSPNTPAVDVYLYSYGMPNAMIVLHHVSYGTVSPYEKVASGEYTVAMRAAGAAPSSTPVLSSNLMVHAGHAYTVAGMGPEKELRLQVLDDQLSTPRGKALVRVIQASLTQHRVTVRSGQAVLASDLAFASVTPYAADAPGTWTVHATGSTENWTGQVKLAAGSIHTLVVLDSAHGLVVTDLTDAAGSGAMPQGGAATGLGGTAPGPAPSPLPWLAGLAAGLLAAAAAAVRLRRHRAVARHAR
ncbi:MAG: DUF4397 domain-containing protein [Streptosporangiaceae bacterium]